MSITFYSAYYKKSLSELHLKVNMEMQVCNPSYSGDGDREDSSLRPLLAKS
jgi:hypothetical protein